MQTGMHSHVMTSRTALTIDSTCKCVTPRVQQHIRKAGTAKHRALGSADSCASYCDGNTCASRDALGMDECSTLDLRLDGFSVTSGELVLQPSTKITADQPECMFVKAVLLSLTECNGALTRPDVW